MPIRAVFRGLALLFYLLLGSRYVFCYIQTLNNPYTAITSLICMGPQACPSSEPRLYDEIGIRRGPQMGARVQGLGFGCFLLTIRCPFLNGLEG